MGSAAQAAALLKEFDAATTEDILERGDLADLEQALPDAISLDPEKLGVIAAVLLIGLMLSGVGYAFSHIAASSLEEAAQTTNIILATTEYMYEHLPLDIKGLFLLLNMALALRGRQKRAHPPT